MHMLGRLVETISSETVIRAPEEGCYRGATAAGYPTINCRGAIALTDARLVFTTLTGQLIEIPLNEITAMRQPEMFNASAVSGRTHLIVRIRTGEIGFFVSDTTAWIKAIARACQ